MPNENQAYLTLSGIINEIGNTYYMLIHQDGEKPSVGRWYVRGVKELMERYNDNPPVFHSDTIEECLGSLLKELRTIRNK